MSASEQAQQAASWQEEFNAALTVKLTELGAKNLIRLHDEVLFEISETASLELARWTRQWLVDKLASVPVKVFTATPVSFKEWKKG